MSSYTIAIAMMGKGSTNHLHRREVVDAFREKGTSVHFLVRPDYFHILNRIPDCEYSMCKVIQKEDGEEFWVGLFRYIRGLYPAYDIGKKDHFKTLNSARSWRSRMAHSIMRFMARYRFMMKLVLALEGLFRRSVSVEGADPENIDQLLLLGAGAAGAIFEGDLTWWARKHGIPVVHAVGNFDNLSSKGFIGTPIKRLLVWGSSMRGDAVRLQGIADDKISEIGSMRYNNIAGIIKDDKEAFLRSIGLDPQKKTILFAGGLEEFHYFEMLKIFQLINNDDDRHQLILRIYPNKRLMNSAYIEPLIEYSKNLPGVSVSLADPNYKAGVRDREVLQIEETELWHALTHCDLVVNMFSTIALEACIFDKPAINMWYFAYHSRLALLPETYWDYSLVFHNRRMASYGAMAIANDRSKLIELIKEAIENPDKLRQERRNTVERECGVLDGKAPARLAQACAHEYTANV